MNTVSNCIYMADAYYRLSREDGDKAESDSIVNQKALVKEFLKSCPDITLYEEKVDDGYTGVNFERPGFQAMLEDIKSGKVNCVIVKDLSRFGRNYIEAGRYIEKIFPYLGVRFIAINDNIDTSANISASDEILIPFKNLINDAYCRDISIKVRSHLEIKRKNGQYIGAFAPYGYKKSSVDKNQLVIDEKAASVVRQIFRCRLEGMSASRIADKLNELGIPTPMEYKQMNGENFRCNFKRKSKPVWLANGVNYILKNEVYTGVLLQGKTCSPNYKVRTRIKKGRNEWIRCENNHEAIISNRDFKLVEELFSMDTRVAPEEKALYLFSGFTKCGYCGGNMTRKTVPVQGKKYVYLVCMENKKRSGCKNCKAISLVKLEQAIIKIINLYIEQIYELNQMLQVACKIPYNGYVSEKLQESIVNKEAEIVKKQHYSKEIYSDYKEGIISREEYQDLKELFRSEIDTLQNEIQAIKMENEKIARDRNDKVQWMQQFIEYRGFTELSRDLLLRLIEEIRIYDKDRVEVSFRFRAEFEELCQFIVDTRDSKGGRGIG